MKNIPSKPQGSLRVTLDQMAAIPLPPPNPIRADTYQPIAKGTCPRCRNNDNPLRFCYNPYGDDDLVCLDCAKAQDSFFNDK